MRTSFGSRPSGQARDISERLQASGSVSSVFQTMKSSLESRTLATRYRFPMGLISDTDFSGMVGPGLGVTRV